MVKRGTAQLITTLVIIAVIAVFFLRFDGFKRLQDLFKSFGLGKAAADSGGGGETTVIVTESTDLGVGTESGASSADAAEIVVSQSTTSIVQEGGPEQAPFESDFSQQIVANISGLGPVTLEESQQFLSPSGFESLLLSLLGQADPVDESKILDVEKLQQEEISKAIGAQQFGEEFASPLGAFANPDFFTDEEKEAVGFIDPVTEPTQKEIQEQKITDLEKQVQAALAEFEKTGIFVLP